MEQKNEKHDGEDMDLPEHTPGPWRRIASRTIGGETYSRQRVVIAHAHHERDIPILCAAPEMLDVLMDIAAMPVARPYPDGPCIERDLMDEVRRVIAKATGKEEA